MRLVFQLPASITSVVDAPRLVNSLASPTRPECAVTRRSTPATSDAAVNRRPIICGDNGTTRSAGSGFVKACSVRMPRATPSFTNRTSFVSPSWFVLLRRTVTSTPSPSVVSTTSDQRRVLTLAAAHSGHEQQSSDHRIETPTLEGDLLGLDATPAPTRPTAGGEHGRQVRDPERLRLASPPIGGGPPVPGQHPDRPLASGSGLAGQLRAEARRGDRHRGARRGAAGVVQLGEVGGEGHIVEWPPVEPGVEPPNSGYMDTPEGTYR